MTPGTVLINNDYDSYYYCINFLLNYKNNSYVYILVINNEENFSYYDFPITLLRKHELITE